MFGLFADAAAIAVLWLLFWFAMFLGLQVRPIYGNMGLAAIAVLAAVYVYFGFIRKCFRHPGPSGEETLAFAMYRRKAMRAGHGAAAAGRMTAPSRREKLTSRWVDRRSAQVP